MENFLPVVIGLILLGFKIYSNFRKEQEKARNRNPSPTEVSLPEMPAPPVEKLPTKPQTILVEEVFDPAHPYEPHYKPVYKEPTVAKPVAEPKYERAKPETIVKERINPEIPVEEVLKGQAIHQPHKHQYPLSHEEEEGHLYSDFDIRDAVIKEAILNRPQY